MSLKNFIVSVYPKPITVPLLSCQRAAIREHELAEAAKEARTEGHRHRLTLKIGGAGLNNGVSDMLFIEKWADRKARLAGEAAARAKATKEAADAEARQRRLEVRHAENISKKKNGRPNISKKDKQARQRNRKRATQ